MNNHAWECPRCNRMNAPFNLHCNCPKDSAEKELFLVTDCKECIRDAAKIFSGGYPGQEVLDRCATELHYNYHIKSIHDNKLMKCSECGNYHANGANCIMF